MKNVFVKQKYPYFIVLAAVILLFAAPLSAEDKMTGADASSLKPPVLGYEPIMKPGKNAAPQGVADGNTQGGMQDVFDIKPPVPPAPGLDDWFFLIYIFGAGLLIVLLYLLYRRYQRRKKQGDIPSPILLTPPEKSAQNALNALEEALMRNEVDAKAYYFKLSFIVRAYIKARFKMDAPEMTTEELLPKLEHLLHLPMAKVVNNMETGGGFYTDKAVIRDLKTFFQSVDPIKYAKGVGFPDQMKKDARRIRHFVEDTTKTADAFKGKEDEQIKKSLRLGKNETVEK